MSLVPILLPRLSGTTFRDTEFGALAMAIGHICDDMPKSLAIFGELTRIRGHNPFPSPLQVAKYLAKCTKTT